MRECGTTKNDICDLLRLRTNDLSDRGRSKSKTHMRPAGQALSLVSYSHR